jgi:hypothetical protein
LVANPLFALLNKPVINGPPPASQESTVKSDDTAETDVKQVLVEKLFTLLKPEEKLSVDKKEPETKEKEKKDEGAKPKPDVDNGVKSKPAVEDAVKAKPVDEVKKEDKKESTAPDEKDKKELKKEPKEGFERGLLEYNSSKLYLILITTFLSRTHNNFFLFTEQRNKYKFITKYVIHAQ